MLYIIIHLCIGISFNSATVEQVYGNVETAALLRSNFPDSVAGFDLVGQEDRSPPLVDLIDPLLTVAEQNVSIPVFYHAAETSET